LLPIVRFALVIESQGAFADSLLAGIKAQLHLLWSAVLQMPVANATWVHYAHVDRPGG
jgi:hypothetical protein